jgi:hypothetical protein
MHINHNVEKKRKKKQGVAPECAQLYPIVHKRKDGTPVNDEVALKIVSSIFLKHV